MQRLLGLEVTRTYGRAALLNVSLRKTVVEALEEVSVEDAGGQKEALWPRSATSSPTAPPSSCRANGALPPHRDARGRDEGDPERPRLRAGVDCPVRDGRGRVRSPRPQGRATPRRCRSSRSSRASRTSRRWIELVKETPQDRPRARGRRRDAALQPRRGDPPVLEGAPGKKGEPRGSPPHRDLELGERTSDIVILQGGETAFCRSLSRGTHGCRVALLPCRASCAVTLAAWRTQGGDLLRGIYLVGGGASAAGAEVFLSTELGVTILPLPELRFEGLTPSRKRSCRASPWPSVWRARAHWPDPRCSILRQAARGRAELPPSSARKIPLLAGLGAVMQ